MEEADGEGEEEEEEEEEEGRIEEVIVVGSCTVDRTVEPLEVIVVVRGTEDVKVVS